MDSTTQIVYQKSATSKVYCVKKFMDLRINKGTPMSTHLSEFNSIFIQVVALNIFIDVDFKDIFLLCTLLESWDIFSIAMSN